MKNVLFVSLASCALLAACGKQLQESSEVEYGYVTMQPVVINDVCILGSQLTPDRIRDTTILSRHPKPGANDAPLTKQSRARQFQLCQRLKLGDRFKLSQFYLNR